MIGLFDRLARPFLLALDPEDAHGLTIKVLKLLPLPAAATDDRRLAMRVFGLNFPNPVGIAAGFDKHAEVPDALLRAGFGFVEVGTVTPLPQPGNPRPRVFRLDADGGVINRLGFNSHGADTVLARLAARASSGGIVGINVGANKDLRDRIADYVKLIESFASVASYVTVNISSPNTPGLRNLQQASVLDDLLARVIDARERVAQNAGPTPVLLKIAPDLTLRRSRRRRRHCAFAPGRRHDRRQYDRRPAAGPARPQDRGRSRRFIGPAAAAAGEPDAGGNLCAGRRRVSAYRRRRHDTGEDALAKIRAGASLIQIYSGLVFRGLPLVAEIKNTLLGALTREGHDNLAAIVGVDAASVTAEPWPG